MDIQKQVQELTRGIAQIVSVESLVKKLESKGRLRIKLGVDPTAPDLHLGHAVVLSKLRQFQDFGHEIIFLLGTFTTRIGDPTGRSKTRPPLTDEQIEQNTQTYFDQVKKILDPTKVTVRRNGEWLDKLSSKEWVQLCAKVTLARIIEREDFAKRLAENQPIGLHEILYPLMQGYDSVELRADVELGGTDQTFNLLMGRHLQEQFGQEPQVVITTPLLEGLDGVQKMSKSYGNYVGLNEPADQAYGKIMSISDELMWRYYEVLLLDSCETIQNYKDSVVKNIVHPMDLKKQLAYRIIERFWSKSEAAQAQEAFVTLFQKKDLSSAPRIMCEEKTYKIIDLVKKLDPELSSSEVRRLIDQGAISFDGTKVSDPLLVVELSADPAVVRIGKHRIFTVVYE